jgi:hypothetical protein
LAVRRTLFALAVLTTALTGTQAASADRLACGAKIADDTVLRADMRGCPATALEIGADGVTLDLGGHTVEGAIVASGRTGLRIRGGVVVGDVRLDRVRRAKVRKLRVRHGSIECLRSAGCTIVRNSVRGGGIAIFQSESGIPNVVRDNLVRRAPGAGIAVDRTDTTTVESNFVTESAIGIEASHAADLLIADNRIFRNSGDGLSGSFGSTAAIVRNVVADNGGDGISLRTWGGETKIARNLVTGNARNGILGAAVAHWRVTRNRAARNGASGIAITGAVEDATLARNLARRNGARGIDVEGVRDGGANRARHNAISPQCVGVACA